MSIQVGEGLRAPAVWRTTSVFRGFIVLLEHGVEFHQIDRLDSEYDGYEKWVPEPSVFSRPRSDVGGFTNLGLQVSSPSDGPLFILDIDVDDAEASEWKLYLLGQGVVSPSDDLDVGGASNRWWRVPDGRSLVSVRLAAIHQRLINRYLELSERVEVVGEAQRLTSGNRGRVTPEEGVIAVTDQHFIFCAKSLYESNELFLDRHFVCSARRKRIMLPNFDRLIFEGRRYSGSWETFELVATKRTVAEVLATVGSASRDDVEAADLREIQALIDGVVRPTCVLWRKGEEPRKVTLSIDDRVGGRDAKRNLALATIQLNDDGHTLLDLKFSEAKAFREISDPSRHQKVSSEFFQGLGQKVTDFFADGFFRAFELIFERGGDADTEEDDEFALYVGFQATDSSASSFRWFLRDSGVSQLWPIPQDSVGEDLALEAHAKSTLRHGYRGENRFLRDAAPRGDSSNVLAVFPYVIHQGDRSQPIPGLGVATEKNLWLIPHYIGQLEDDPMSNYYIRSIPWSQIEAWGQRYPIWGQQLLTIVRFTKPIDPKNSFSEEIERQRPLPTEGLLFWGRKDHNYVIELIKQMIRDHGAFDPGSREKTL